MERATKLFDDFHAQQQKLRIGLNKAYRKISSSLDVEFPELMKMLNNAYHASLAVMNTLHAKTDEGLIEKIHRLNTTQEILTKNYELLENLYTYIIKGI